MPLKDIAVYLDATPESAPRLQTALALASKHDARLIGVDISTKEAYEGDSRDLAMAIEENFIAAVEQSRLKYFFHAAPPDARSAEQLYSHCADLLVTTQPHPDRLRLANPAVPKDILVTAGVPMLVLPTSWTGTEAIGEDIVIAYNFSREATRALHDALPLLTVARNVFIFIFSKDYSRDHPHVQAVKEHLEHHGVNATLAGWHDRGETDMISALFAGLDREEADLIVCGAYGHSPLFEDMFGGATRDLLNNISMPVLMSH